MNITHHRDVFKYYLLASLLLGMFTVYTNIAMIILLVGIAHNEIRLHKARTKNE